MSRNDSTRFFWICCAVVFNSRAASPGCGVMTRMVFMENLPVGSQSSALASTTIGNSESHQSCCVNAFIFPAVPGAARPGPIKMALVELGNFNFGFQTLTITACNCDATAP